jgi:hypothetical protein
MSNQNRPLSVLLPTYASVLGAGSRVENLNPGQIGFFNADTGLSFVAATVAGDPSVARRFFIAVGVDRDGDAATDDIVKSAGEAIQAHGIDWYDVQCYLPAQPKIVDLLGFQAQCDTIYSIKFEIRNQAAYRSHGFNQAVQTFTVKTGCCDECATCPTGDCNELAELLHDNINNQEEAWVIASYVTYLGTIDVDTPSSADGDAVVTIGDVDITVSVLNADTDAQVAAKIAAAINADANYSASVVGTVVTVAANSAVTISFDAGTATDTAVTIVQPVITAVADLAAYKAAYGATACVGLRFTSSPMAIESYCNINLKYFQPRGTDIIVSLTQGSGFDCSGALSVVQELAFEQGRGYDLKELEYQAGGWNGKPGVYRVSTLAGVAVGNYDSFADAAGHYVQINLGYLNKAQAGWQQYESPLETIIAFPCEDGEDGDPGDIIVNILDAIVNTVSGRFPARTAKLIACDACPELEVN